MKPTVFIASSFEGKKIAEEVQLRLRYEANCTIWDQGVFDLSFTALDNLLSGSGISKWSQLPLKTQSAAMIHNQTCRRALGQER